MLPKMAAQRSLTSSCSHEHNLNRYFGRVRYSEFQKPTRGGLTFQRMESRLKLNDFLEKIGSQDNRKIKELLGKILDAFHKLALPEINQEWLVEELMKTTNVNSEKELRSFLNGLGERAAKASDQELSGQRGHMMSRHVMVDRGSQEERLRDPRGPKRATRIEQSKQYATKYKNYVQTMKKLVPEKIKEHVSAMCHNILLTMQDGGFKYSELKDKKDAIAKEISSMALKIDLETCTLAFNWTTSWGRDGVLTLTCEPKATSSDMFMKVITEKDNEGKSLEKTEFGLVDMYWGSNRLKIDGLTPDTEQEQLNEKLEALDFTLGVTQF